VSQGELPEPISLFTQEQLRVFSRKELKDRRKPMANTLRKRLLNRL